MKPEMCTLLNKKTGTHRKSSALSGTSKTGSVTDTEICHKETNGTVPLHSPCKPNVQCAVHHTALLLLFIYVAMTVQLPLVLVLLTMAAYTPASEGIFTFPPRPSRPTGTPPPLRCDSVLVQNNPDNYPHCWCTYSRWTDWKYVTTTDNRTCASNRTHILERTRSSLSSKCSTRTESETKYICELNIMHMHGFYSNSTQYSLGPELGTSPV